MKKNENQITNGNMWMMRFVKTLARRKKNWVHRSQWDNWYEPTSEDLLMTVLLAEGTHIH